MAKPQTRALSQSGFESLCLVFPLRLSPTGAALARTPKLPVVSTVSQPSQTSLNLGLQTVPPLARTVILLSGVYFHNTACGASRRPSRSYVLRAGLLVRVCPRGAAVCVLSRGSEGKAQSACCSPCSERGCTRGATRPPTCLLPRNRRAVFRGERARETLW